MVDVHPDRVRSNRRWNETHVVARIAEDRDQEYRAESRREVDLFEDWS